MREGETQSAGVRGWVNGEVTRFKGGGQGTLTEKKELSKESK